METYEKVQEFDQCDYIGPVLFEDLDGRTFFSGARVHNMNVNIGDLVRVVLEDGDTDDAEGDSFGYCQVLAIYDEKESETRRGEGVHFEARWFSFPHELDAKRKKIFPNELPNELVETDVLDDIPIGSVSGPIQILQGTTSTASPSSSKNAAGRSTSTSNTTSTSQDGASGDSYFLCRFMILEGSGALQPIQMGNIFTRGMTLSHYRYAYISYLASLPASDFRSTCKTHGKPRAGADGTGTASSSADESELYSKAIRKLHVSVLPSKLPCRSEERNEIYAWLKKSITNRDDGSKPIYLSGMPGTGKTATVLATINELRVEADQGLVPHFDFVEINCLRLQAPSQAYTVLWRGLSGLHATSERARKELQDRFENASINKHLTQNRNVMVVLVDELDYLMTRDDSVVYNFFNWPMFPGALLVVIGVANIMDLPERLTTAVTSRAGLAMSRMVFRPYEFDQIEQILEGRLQELNLGIFNKSSLGLLSRKAATVAGDLRAALKICQRTIELYRDQKDDIARKKAIYEEQMAERAAQEAALFTKGIRDGVTSNSIEDISDALAPVPPPAETSMMKLITRATTEYKESPMMATMSRLCTLDKALLVAACKHLRATDSMEINADTLWCRLGDLLQLARQNPEITLLTPPQFIFDEALDRLVKLGLFDQTGRRGSEMGRGGGNAAGSALGSTRYGPRAQSFTFNLEFTDVVACLKEDLLAKFL